MNNQDYIASGIIESVVLGIASAPEVEELMRMRKQHPEIDKAIIDFEQRLEQQGLSKSVSPPPGIKANLFKTLEPEFESARDNDLNEERSVENIPARLRIPAFWKYVIAASVILFIVNTIGGFVLYNKYQELNSAYSILQGNYLDLQKKSNSDSERLLALYRDVEMMQDSAMAVVKMKGVSGKETSMATVYWDTRTKDVYLFSNNLPPAESGKQYQLWAIVDGKPVDAGVIGNCQGLCKLKNIQSAQAFAITLEKAGGNPTPTMSSMYVMGKV